MSMTATSDGLRIDPIVLPVRSDKPDIDDAVGIVDPNHNTILVTGDIENRAAIIEDARAADGSLQLRRRRPISTPDLLVPSHYRLARVCVCGTSVQEGLKRASRNDPHGNILA